MTGLFHLGIMDCKGEEFSDIVQDSRWAERKSEREAEDCIGARRVVAGCTF